MVLRMAAISLVSCSAPLACAVGGGEAVDGLAEFGEANLQRFAAPLKLSFAAASLRLSVLSLLQWTVQPTARAADMTNATAAMAPQIRREPRRSGRLCPC